MSEREEKKAQFAPERKRGNRWLVMISLLVSTLGLGGWIFASGKGGSASAGAATVGGKFSIPLAQVSDGKAHFFTHQGESTAIKFFVVKSSDGKFRSAFDTCDVCYKAKKGYRQDGESMICNNCEQKFASDKIGEISGGCNPAPLTATIVSDRLEVAAADLERGAWYFQ